MNTKKYLITLTPQGKFYFGGDNTFELKGNNDYNDKFGSYIVRSNYFPQQTSLLGMLRFILLSGDSSTFSRETMKIIDPEKAQQLIGAKGFHANENNDFGKIKNIGTCFIRKGNEKFSPAPKDLQLQIDFLQTTEGKFNGKPRIIPDIKSWDKKDNKLVPYTAKFHHDDLLVSENRTVKFEEVFEEDRRVGINKSYSGKKDEQEKGFFKQISYRLKNDFVFAFSAEIAEDYNFMQHNGVTVQIGGDNSNFMLTVEKIQSDIEVKYPVKDEKLKDKLVDFQKITLTANAFIAKDNIDFAIAETLPFKFLKTTVNTAKYDLVSTKGADKSERYELFAAGSVFFFQSKEKMNGFITAIDEHKTDFQKIGYNKYIINN
ncbi:MAG: hypothetical protein LBC89_02685 [Bacteroidales bacterium]|jgi:CRISPR-associated protein Cmr3|nr:hypothetical protein [Bacteroidales bacterium]